MTLPPPFHSQNFSKGASTIVGQYYQARDRMA
jgi:hypothetical protein